MVAAAGTFDITSRPQPPFATESGVLLGRMEFDKVFHGALEGTSVVYMTYARTPVDTSAGYVAVERIAGSLEGRQGSFVMLHTGVTHGGDLSLDLAIVPNSGTEDLAGITGSMRIDDSDGRHAYTLEYRLADD